MKTVGIIAEYNPFHNGHQYQIEEIKKRTGAENIVAVMSGSFVQRGAPAWADKYLRTEMALSSGVDFVFELPVVFSCASAEHFAQAGVSLLSSIGFVDGICFGAECEDLETLMTMADILADPSDNLNRKIKEKTMEGLSYPSAREESLKAFYPALFSIHPGFLSSPNNILAVEYLKAIKRTNSSLMPILIQRNDTGYHDTILHPDSPFSSASAIRRLFETETKDQFFHKADPYLPKNVKNLLVSHPYHYPVTENDFSDLLYYRLQNLSEEDLAIEDMSEEIYHRIRRYLNQYETFSSFAEKVKTKQYTYSRISRVLFHLLLNIKGHREPPVPYARLLGFRKEKSPQLRNITKVPVITKPADGMDILSQNLMAQKLYQKDLSASNLYRQILRSKQTISRISKKNTEISEAISSFSIEKPALENEFFQGPVIL